MVQPFHDPFETSHTVAALRRNRRLAFWAGTFFLVGTVMFAWIIYAGGFEAWLLAFAVGCGIFAGWALTSWWRATDLSHHPLLCTIKDHPDQIVWFYLQKQQVRGATNTIVYIRCAPRREFLLYTVNPEAVVSELQSWCPHAKVGWSKVLQTAWERDPSSVRGISV